MQLLAYLDPGTGSIFIQVVLGTVLAGTVLFRNFFRGLFGKLKLRFSRGKTADEED